MRSTIIAAISLAFFQAALAVDSPSAQHHDKRLLNGLIGPAPSSMRCASQYGLVNVAVLDKYNCGGNSDPFNGGNLFNGGNSDGGMINCGSGRGLANVGVLNDYNCGGGNGLGGSRSLVLKANKEHAPASKRAESDPAEHLEKRLLVTRPTDSPIGCASQNGLVNVDLLSTYHCNGGQGGFGQPGNGQNGGMPCPAQRGLVNLSLINNSYC